MVVFGILAGRLGIVPAEELQYPRVPDFWLPKAMVSLAISVEFVGFTDSVQLLLEYMLILGRILL